MKTAIFIGVLLGMLGCGDNNAVPQPAAVDNDAGLGDACVMAQGNCDCVFYEDDNNGVITTKVSCP